MTSDNKALQALQFFVDSYNEGIDNPENHLFIKQGIMKTKKFLDLEDKPDTMVVLLIYEGDQEETRTLILKAEQLIFSDQEDEAISDACQRIAYDLFGLAISAKKQINSLFKNY